MRARTLSPRAALLALPIALLFVAVPAQAADAASTKLVVTSPAKGETVVGLLNVRARLKVGSKARVKSARFYVQRQLISTDTKAPFTIARSASINTSTLRAGANRIRIKVVYSVRKPSGKLVEKTQRQRIRVHVFRPPSATQPLPAANWNQVFSDDFTTAASANNWKTQRDDWIKHGIPYSNLEGAGYLSSNVKIANGTLSIATSQRPAGGFNQSTGSINTNKIFDFKFGYLESRMLIPACGGCWPAFWMLPSADHWPPEIDIIEYFDTSKAVVPYSAVHWAVPGPTKEEYFSKALYVSPTDNYLGTWHTYGVLWTSNTVQFYIDGVAGPQFSEPSQIPQLAMYPIIQLAVGAGNRPPAGSTMQVDYVRAWQRSR